MKKVALIILTYASILNAQNQGTVLYQMTIEGLPDEQAAMMGDMEMKMVWKDNKFYSEQNSMMYSIKTAGDDKSVIMLMDMMGNKNFMRINPEDPKYKEDDRNKKEDDKNKIDYKVEYTNDTKKIAGYDCKKAIVTGKSKDGKDFNAEVWYTEQIPNVYAQQKYKSKRNQEVAYLKGIKGMPLEYSIPQQGMTIKITAKEINFNPVSDDIFNLSTEGYTEIKPEDMKRWTGGE